MLEKFAVRAEPMLCTTSAVSGDDHVEKHGLKVVARDWRKKEKAHARNT